MLTTATRPPRAAAASQIADVAKAASAYLTARRAGDVAKLSPLVASVWHGKYAAPGGALRVEQHASLLARLAAAEGVAADLSAVHMCLGDFAVVRADTWDPPCTSFLLMFAEDGAWKIAGEARADPGSGELADRFHARAAEADVLAVLETYYRAVTYGDPDAVRGIFASCWHMKNHENGAIVCEETEAFAARLEAGPLQTYWTDRQIADVQIAANRIAYVRVDRPSTPSTTVFLLARIDGVWKIIDKAWTDQGASAV